MNQTKISARRLAAFFVLWITITVLLAGCANQQVKQGEGSRIPDTSFQLTATSGGNVTTRNVPQIASPSPVLLPSKSLTEPTQGAFLSSLPTDIPQPTRTATPEVIKVDPACLVGKWQVSDLPVAMAQSYSQSGSSLQLQGVDGQATYNFDGNGNMTIAFSHLIATFMGTIDNRDVTAQQGLDGSGTARYQVNPVEGQAVFSDFGGQGLLSTLDINGQRIAEGNIPVWRAFTSSLSDDTTTPPSLVEYSRASVRCDNDTMTIQAVEPLPGPVVNLSREK